MSVLLLSNLLAKEVRQAKNWMWGGEVLTIHRFGHRSGQGERSGVCSTAKVHDLFSARGFLDMSQEEHIHNIIEFWGQTRNGVGRG